MKKPGFGLHRSAIDLVPFVRVCYAGGAVVGGCGCVDITPFIMSLGDRELGLCSTSPGFIWSRRKEKGDGTGHALSARNLHKHCRRLDGLGCIKYQIIDLVPSEDILQSVAVICTRSLNL